MQYKKKQYNKVEVNEGDKLKELGNDQLHLEKYDKAIEYYTKAIKIDPKNYAYFHNRSLAYYLLEKFQKSLDDILLCKYLNKEYIQVYIREASAYHQLDELEKALAAANEGLFIEAANEQLLQLKETITNELAVQKEEMTNPVTDSLLGWIKSNKGEFSGIKLKFSNDSDRNIVSRRVILPNEIVISIPPEQVITTDLVSSSPLCQSLSAAKVNLNSQRHTFFALFLLQEKLKGEASHFKPYIDALPSDLSSFPALYSEEELKWLEGSAALKLIQEQKHDIEQDYKAVCEALAEFKVEFEQFRWARLCSQSRVFSVLVKGVKTSVMVPLVDMLNHKRTGSEETEWGYDAKTDSFNVKAVKRISRHSNINFSYGSKCNSKLFLNYGFVELQDHELDIQMQKDQARPGHKVMKSDYRGINYFNEFPVLFCFDELSDDATLPIKAKLIGGAIPKCCLIRINEDFETQNSTGFLGYLRFISIRDPVQLIKLMESHKKFAESQKQPNLPFLPQKTPPLSVENEYRMWQRVQELLIPLLIQYKSSVVKDNELLASNELTTNQRNCVLIRLGEKNILEYFIDMASKMMYLLENKEKKEILEAARTDKQYGPYFHYIIQVILARLLYQK